MLDFKFEGMIFAHTAGELLEQLEAVADETPIKPEDGLWAGVSKFAVREETFIDAFDRTVYQLMFIFRLMAKVSSVSDCIRKMAANTWDTLLFPPQVN